MKKIKFFADPIEELEPWLNGIAREGYRLTSVKNFLYTFERSEGPLYYAVQYVGTTPHREVEEYTSMLRESGSEIFFAPINQGNIARGKVRLRSYAKGSAKLSGTFMNYNKELLIVEFKDERPIPLLTTNQDIADQYRSVKNTYLYGVIAMTLLLGIILYDVYKKGIDLGNGGKIILCGIVWVWFFKLFLNAKSHARKCSEESNVLE